MLQEAAEKAEKEGLQNGKEEVVDSAVIDKVLDP